MSSDPREPLRVLIANERQDRLQAVTIVVESLGHVVDVSEAVVEGYLLLPANGQ